MADSTVLANGATASAVSTISDVNATKTLLSQNGITDEGIQNTLIEKGFSASVQSQVQVLNLGSKDAQVQWLSDNIPGLSSDQAGAILEAANGKGLDPVFGGSRVRAFFGYDSYQPMTDTSDLDVGYSPSSVEDGRSANAMGKAIGRIMDSLTANPADGDLPLETGIRIFDGNNPPSGYIPTAESFFQTLGMRANGQPFIPSGSIRVMPNGVIQLTTPGYLH